MITDAVTDFEGKPEGKPADGTEEADRLAGDLAAPRIEDEIGTRSLAEIAKEACEAIGIEPAPELVADADGDDGRRARRIRRSRRRMRPSRRFPPPHPASPPRRGGEGKTREGMTGSGRLGPMRGWRRRRSRRRKSAHDPPSG